MAPGTRIKANKSREEGQTAQKDLVFIGWTPSDDSALATGKSGAQKREVRAQAARISAQARLETIRRRSAENSLGPHGQRAFNILFSGKPQQQRTRKSADQLGKNKHPPSDLDKEHEALAQCCRDREASVTVHAHKVLGGSIPINQANIAFLGQFLNRFSVGYTAERPWVQLVVSSCESDTSNLASLSFMALQANASALCANDLRQPEIERHAIKQYLSTIALLQSELRSPRWHYPVVMYTCMILTLFECIQSNNPSARRAHVSGVASLIQQRGPESFTTGLEHKTFRYYRINILMMALRDRQPIFLADPAWKNIPFSGDCPPKTILDQLVDILLEIPAVLATVEILRKGDLTRLALVQKAFELAYRVRSSTWELERWKETCVWTYPVICGTPQLHNLGIVALCELVTRVEPYDVKLGEAVNCYNAAHLMLARIAQGLADRSFIVRNLLVPPYRLHDLVAAIVLVSRRHISGTAVDMVSMVVTTFPLKVAQSTTEVDEPLLRNDTLDLLSSLNEGFNRRFNINYCL